MQKSRKVRSAHSRPLIFAASSVWVALILVFFVFRGGGAVPVGVAELHLSPSITTLAQQAGALAAAGDFEGAWGVYYEALQAAPEDTSLWYGLGVTLSHLDRREETEQAFQHVVRHGPPESEEVRVARLWLVRVGVLAEPGRSTPASERVEAGEQTAALKGRTSWGALDPGPGVLKVRISLEGMDGEAQGKLFTTRVPLNQSYRFEQVPPGSYRLIGDVADRRLWDLVVAVKEGEGVIVDLSKDNSHNPTVALSR